MEPKYTILIDDVKLVLGRIGYDAADCEFGRKCDQFPRSWILLFENDEMIKEQEPGELPAGWSEV